MDTCGAMLAFYIELGRCFAQGSTYTASPNHASKPKQISHGSLWDHRNPDSQGLLGAQKTT